MKCHFAYTNFIARVFLLLTIPLCLIIPAQARRVVAKAQPGQ